MADRNILNLPLSAFLGGQEFIQAVQPTGLAAPADYRDVKVPAAAFTNFNAGTGAQTANTVYAGPTTGVPAAPTFRTLVNADIPSLDTLNFNTNGVITFGGAVTVTHSTAPSQINVAGGELRATRTTPLAIGLSGFNTANSAVVRLLTLTGQRGTGAINDEGHISWNMALSNTASTEAGRMRIRMLNVTSGAQQADFIFSLCNNASTQVDSIAIGRTAIYPATDAAIALGIAASNRWNGLNLATTTALNWNNGNATITHSAGQLAFATGGTEAFRLDSAQRMIFGGVASLNIFSINASLQVNGNLADTSAASIARFSTPIGGPNLTFAKSHNAVVGTNTIVQVNEELGNINFVGANGTTYDAAARIQALVDGTPGAANDMPGRLVFFTTPDGSATLTEAMRIDNAQRLLIGQTGGTITVAAGGTNPLAQVAGTTAAAAWSAARFSADANPSRLFLSKSRNAAIGSHTIVQSGDSVGELLFAGSNGTQFDNVASVAAVIDGTPGAANDMPGRLVFSTVPDGSSTLTERLRITQDGVLVTGGTAAQFSNLNVELHGITAAKGVMTHCLWEASANGIIWQMRKSRGASIGSFTIVQNNDTLGILNAFGADGTQYIQAAQIIFSVDGTPGTNDMPGRIAFLTTPDGASAPTEKLRITNDGRVQAFSTTGLTGGGNTSMAYQLSSTLIGVYAGSGPPTITAPKGSLYLRSDGTTTNDRAYINTNGATTWTAITTVA